MSKGNARISLTRFELDYARKECNSYCKKCGMRSPKCICCSEIAISPLNIWCDGRRHLCHDCYNIQKKKGD